MSKKLFVAFALCLSLLGSTSPILAQADEKTDQDVLSQLLSQGWKIVGDGVLQRELRAGEVETFVFGVSGFTWKIRDLQAQLRKLRTELQASPTPELRKAIANQRKLIASAQRARDLAKSTEDLGEVDLSKVSCTINFAYDAGAGGKTDVQGTWASSSASFSANCGGFSGQVYAYAFAKATVNGAPSTHTVTDGPRSGANVSASAFAAVNGVDPCESNSYGEMVSYSLNPSSYSKTAQNYSCPVIATPPTVTVSASPSSSSGSPFQLYGYDCVTITWTTNISGGTSPYTTTMYRNNVSLGQRTTYSEQVCNAQSTYLETITVRSDVVDGAGKTASASNSAYVQHHYYEEYQDPCYSDPRLICN